MKTLAILIFADFENNQIQSFTYPADSQVLFRNIRPAIKPVWSVKYLPRLFEADPAPGIGPQLRALDRVKAKTH
jgi:hypothetical protein